MGLYLESGVLPQMPCDVRMGKNQKRVGWGNASYAVLRELSPWRGIALRRPTALGFHMAPTGAAGRSWAREGPRLRELRRVQNPPEPGALGSVTERLSPEERSRCTCRLYFLNRSWKRASQEKPLQMIRLVLL